MVDCCAFVEAVHPCTEALCHLFADALTLVLEFMLSVDGTLTILCRCWSVGESVGWQRHAQLKGIDNLGSVERSKAVSCSEAPRNTSNSSVLSDLISSACHRIVRWAMECE